MDPLDRLVALLALERLEENLFRGQSQDLGWGQVFGGQVLGQALSAASQTVPTDRAAHSLHGYFPLTGAADRPVIYDVHRIRDGNSFTTRRVLAIQAGRVIFSMSASFQRAEEGFQHQDVMRDAPPPEGLPSQTELVRQHAHGFPESMRSRLTREPAIEIRPIEPMNYLAPDRRPPTSRAWLRANGRLPDSTALHQHVLAYASDFNFLSTSLYPHGKSFLLPGMQVASLDHALWIHRPFRADEWLLQQVESPSASGARGLSLARFFTRDGTLVATAAQEGLIRHHGDPAPATP